MFETKGRIAVSAPAGAEEQLFEIAAGAGADDVRFDGDEDEPSFTVLTSVPAYIGVKQAIEKAKLSVTEARIEQIPTTMSVVSGENARHVMDLIEALEDNDDVQHVAANFDIADDVLARLTA